ncbi:MAG: hypothetical protein HYV95_16030 [Opitutae bacterium]|nr:hypothetical protein [Opitutae bacterium]
MTVIFRQRDRTDCGAACLRFIDAHYRRDVTVARLRQLAGTNQRGSTALGLVEAARQLGFTTKGVKGPVDAWRGPRQGMVGQVFNFIFLYETRRSPWTSIRARCRPWPPRRTTSRRSLLRSTPSAN